MNLNIKALDTIVAVLTVAMGLHACSGGEAQPHNPNRPLMNVWRLSSWVIACPNGIRISQNPANLEIVCGHRAGIAAQWSWQIDVDDTSGEVNRVSMAADTLDRLRGDFERDGALLFDRFRETMAGALGQKERGSLGGGVDFVRKSETASAALPEYAEIVWTFN